MELLQLLLDLTGMRAKYTVHEMSNYCLSHSKRVEVSPFYRSFMASPKYSLINNYGIISLIAI